MDLNNTYVQYNRQGSEKLQQIVANDNSASALGAGSLASRIGTKGSAKHKVDSWDLVEGFRKGSVDFEDVDVNELPANLRGLEEKKLEAELQRIGAERDRAKREINTIQKKRAAYIRKTADAAEGAGLDEAMADVLADQL